MYLHVSVIDDVGAHIIGQGLRAMVDTVARCAYVVGRHGILLIESRSVSRALRLSDICLLAATTSVCC